LLLFSLILQSIQPQTILFRMVLRPIWPLVTVQPDCAVHQASYHCVQNGSLANPASCHCSAWLCSPSSLRPFCSEFFCGQSSLLSLFSLNVQSIQPHTILFRMVLRPIQALVTVQSDCVFHPASYHFVQNASAANPASCQCSL